MMENDTARFDSEILSLVHDHSHPALTRAMMLVSTVASPVACVLLTFTACALFWRLRKRTDATYLAITVVGALILEYVLKLSFHRPRPVPFYGLAAPASFSFPSGHALVSLCFLIMLAYLASSHLGSVVGKLALMALAVILSLVVGYSRIYLGVHYPSDVLAGFAAGSVWVVAIMAILAKVKNTCRSY
jgi:membrane-associated phospholipid phosphatase